MYRYVSTESTHPHRRWTLSLLTALTAMLLVAGPLARFYPEGIIRNGDTYDGPIVVMFVLPEIEIEADTEPAVEPVKEKPRQPEPPRDDILDNALRNRIIFEAGLVQVVSDSTWTPRLVLPDLTDLRFSLVDTNRITPWNNVLFIGAWDQSRVQSLSVIHGQRYQRFLANQKSIFNEDWLSGEVLK